MSQTLSSFKDLGKIFPRKNAFPKKVQEPTHGSNHREIAKVKEPTYEKRSFKTPRPPESVRRDAQKNTTLPLAWFGKCTLGENPKDWFLFYKDEFLGSIFLRQNGTYLAQCFCVSPQVEKEFAALLEAKAFINNLVVQSGVINLDDAKSETEDKKAKEKLFSSKLYIRSKSDRNLKQREKWLEDYLLGLKFYFAPDAEFVKFNSHTSDYALATTEAEGIKSYFDYEGSSPNEVTMGIDLGTSSVKVVFHTSSLDESGRDGSAVPFLKARGIDAYLLPTKLWLRSDGVYSLSLEDPNGAKCFTKLKLDFMEPNPTEEEAFRFKVFLALVIRHARSWYYENYPYAEGIQWSVVIGTPSSIEQESFLVRWKEALLESWLLAEKEGPICEGDVSSETYRDVNSKNALKDYFSAVCEVQAEAYAFVEDYPRQTTNRYILIDIGSSTVDIAAFKMIRGDDYKIYFTIDKCDVRNYGTTQLHYERLKDFWKQGLLLSKERSLAKKIHDRLISDVDRELSVTLTGPLPYSVKDYLTDVNIERGNNFEKFENRLKAKVAKQLVEIHKEEPFSTPVILCGGGSRSKFYSDAYEKFVLKSRRVIRPEPIRNLKLPIPIQNEDHDRLLVAYGLATINFGGCRSRARTDGESQIVLNEYTGWIPDIVIEDTEPD